MENEDATPEQGELVSRSPEEIDLVNLCRELNQRGARYIVIGGFAIITAGYPRSTGDVDLLIDTELENESRVFGALSTLPDKAVLELHPGEVAEYTVVRVGDEITVDLMQSASGIDYAEAIQDAVYREIGGVVIPFASPRLLWRMKCNTHREKDAGDLYFLRQQYSEEIFGKGE